MGGLSFQSCGDDDNPVVENPTPENPDNPSNQDNPGNQENPGNQDNPGNQENPGSEDKPVVVPDASVDMSSSEIAERLYDKVEKTIAVSELSISSVNGGTIKVSGITNDNVAEVGYKLFEAELKEDLVVVLDGGASFTKIPDNAFNNEAPKTLSKSKWGYDLTFVIPETVKEVGENAFLGFRGSIVFMGEPPTFGKNAFYCWADDEDHYIMCDFYVRRQYIDQFKKDHVRIDSYEEKGQTYYESSPWVYGIVDRKVSKTIESADFDALLRSIHECDETTITINGINNDNFMVWADAMEKFVMEDECREDAICANINLILNSDGTLAGGLGSIFDYISLKSLVLPEGLLAFDMYCFENLFCDELTIPKSIQQSGERIFAHSSIANKLIIKTECILDLEYLNSKTLVVYVPESVLSTYQSEYPNLYFKAIGKEDVKKDNPDGSIEGLDRWGSIY